MSDLARIESERVGDVCVVRLRGEVDLSNAEQVLEALEASAGGDVSALVVDLSEVAYLDSAGVRVLFSLSERLRATRREFRLAVPQHAPIRSVLDLMDVPRAVPIAGDVDAALSQIE